MPDDTQVSLRDFLGDKIDDIKSDNEGIKKTLSEHGERLAMIETKVESKASIMPRRAGGGIDRKALVQAVVIIATAIAAYFGINFGVG